MRNERDMVKKRRRGRVCLRRDAEGQNDVVLVSTAQPRMRTTGGRRGRQRTRRRVVRLAPRERARVQ